MNMNELMNIINLEHFYLKNWPKSAKTKQNDKILKNVVGGPTRRLEGDMTGRRILDWEVVKVVGFEGFTECMYRPSRASAGR